MGRLPICCRDPLNRSIVLWYANIFGEIHVIILWERMAMNRSIDGDFDFSSHIQELSGRFDLFSAAPAVNARERIESSN